ncbi:MAG: hypothetical protein ACRDZO_27920 [Egibacteraceae bacterium]
MGHEREQVEEASLRGERGGVPRAAKKLERDDLANPYAQGTRLSVEPRRQVRMTADLAPHRTVREMRLG